MKRAALAFALLAGCAHEPAAAQPERVDETMWLDAQQQAHLIDPSLPYRPSVPLILHASPEQLCVLWDKPADCSVVATYYRKKGVVVFDSTVRWGSSDVAQSFIIHEAAHSQQPDHWPQGCREKHAYAVQATWLAMLGYEAEAEKALETAELFECEQETRNAP